ncbi:hypothetical protein BT93_B3208 [Corymbia citriodora subsp. variegata]|nr:hypothetical protein BT93_B3208 [Corymbia citriodora subsp. variegata]
MFSKFSASMFKTRRSSSSIHPTAHRYDSHGFFFHLQALPSSRDTCSILHHSTISIAFSRESEGCLMLNTLKWPHKCKRSSGRTRCSCCKNQERGVPAARECYNLKCLLRCAYRTI